MVVESLCQGCKEIFMKNWDHFNNDFSVETLIQGTIQFAVIETIII